MNKAVTNILVYTCVHKLAFLAYPCMYIPSISLYVYTKHMLICIHLAEGLLGQMEGRCLPSVDTEHFFPKLLY